MKPREKFQTLLRELFQIEATAELDFGIYRIMGQKRGVIERFIDENGFARDADEVFVNNDSFVKEAKSLDPVFKSRMFNEPD